VREDVQVGLEVIAEPVVVVDADVAMLDDMAQHLLGHRRRCRHLYKGSTTVTGEGPDAEGGEEEEEESAATRERGRGEGWGEARERERTDEGRSRPAGASPPFIERVQAGSRERPDEK